jgi:hypothetical protein
MTGRDFNDAKGKQTIALGRYVLSAFAQTCRDVARPLPTAAVEQLRQLAAAPGLR